MLGDVALGQLSPTDGRQPLGFVSAYFGRGLSTEARLRNAFAKAPEDIDSRLAHGWLADPRITGTTDPAVDMAVYGSSFGLGLCRGLSEVSAATRVRCASVSLATPVWSIASAERDQHAHEARTAVLSIMTSDLPLLETMTPLTWYTSELFAYTQPRARIDGDTLTLEEPEVTSFDDLQTTLRDQRRWDRWRHQLATSDAAFDPILFDRSPLDESVTARLLRRAWLDHRQAKRRESSADDLEHSFDLMEALVRRFATLARDAGRQPIVYVAANRSSEHLAEPLLERVRRVGVPFVDSRPICDHSRPRCYAHDGAHFGEEANRAIARQVLELATPTELERSRTLVPIPEGSTTASRL